MARLSTVVALRLPAHVLALLGLSLVMADALAATPLGLPALFAETELVSVGLDGEAPDGNSAAPDLSDDGRFVVFVSWATNLVPRDTNQVADVFVRDRLLGTTERVSVASAGGQADGESDRPHISASGRFVAFRSTASNLVPGDTNRLSDVFVHDRLLGTTERVSVATDGEEGDAPVETVAISGNGQLVMFSSRAGTLDLSSTTGAMRIFVRDRTAGTTSLLALGAGGVANGDSHASGLSPDGRLIAFRSKASNLLAGDTNARSDAFVHDRTLGRTIRVSLSSTRGQGDRPTFRPQLSSSGRFVVFRSFATNLVADDTNGQIDVFVRDLLWGRTTRVSVSSSGEQANARPLLLPHISGDGRFVVFGSFATNLVVDDTNGKTDVFLHDRDTATTRLVSLGLGGFPADGDSYRPRISGDGRTIAFPSAASNLVANDRNGLTDVFVRRL